MLAAAFAQVAQVIGDLAVVVHRPLSSHANLIIPTRR